MEQLIKNEMEKRSEIANSFDTNYLLEAGAGAGKTTIIVDRVINHIIDGSVKPQNIVAITFTKAASLELAQRIQRKALDYLSKEEYFFAKERLERVEEIFTGTIHSFCELLLREMPFEAGLTPGYEIVESSEDFYEKIWYEFLREFEDSYKEDIKGLNRFNIDYRELKQSAFIAMDNPDIDFVGFKDKLDFKLVEEKFESINTNPLDASFVKTGSNFGKLCISIIEDKKDLGHYIDIILMECSKLSEEEDLASKFIYKKHLMSDGVEETVDFMESLLAIYKDLNSIIYNMCTDFIRLAVDYKDKRYTNSLTFNDLLFRASNLIRTSTKARTHFKNKFKCFYIDEAQDTDPMQAELLLLLSHDGDIEDLKSLDDVKPRNGSLFIVGDPKQSIYRFRRADITIYESVKKIIASFGEVVYLDINFRSTDSICRWVEKNFKDRMDGFAFTKQATNVQAGFEKILSLWRDDEKEIGEEKVKLSGVYGYKFSEDMGIKEEEYVAAIVEDIINTRFIDEKVGREKIETRKVENKDIMILTKSNEETGRYLNALKARNVPALLAGEKRLGDTREVLNLYLLIDFITHYKDEIKLVATLRNSFYLEFETINYLLRLERKDKILFHEEKIKTIKHPHLKGILVYLSEVFVESKILRPITFIELLIKNRMGIYDCHKEYSEIEKRDADTSLVQTIEILKAKKPISLYKVKEELEEIIEKKVNYELPLDLDFAQNAVRIMNIHKAKGLESSIVILAGAGKKRTLGGDRYYVEKTENKTKGYIVYKKGLLVNCPGEADKRSREREFKDAELDRLIYVAATRTKSVLITPHIEDEKYFLQPLSNNFSQIIDAENIEIKKEDEGSNFRKLEEIEITNTLIKRTQISKPSYSKLRPSTLDEFETYDKDIELLKDKYTPRGIVYGVIVHRVFEIILKDKLDIKSISEEEVNYAIKVSIKESLGALELDKDILEGLYPNNTFDLQDITDKEDIMEDLSIYLCKNLKKVIDSFLNNKDIIGLFSNAKKIFTEFPFTASVDPTILNKEDSGENIIVNGFIDLLIENKDDSFVIIDYKTDIVSNESFQETFRARYINQLEIYKEVLEEVLKEQDIIVDRLLIYSTYLEKIICLKEIFLA